MVGWGIMFLLDEESAMSRAIAEGRGTLIRNWSKKVQVAASRPQTTTAVAAKADSYISELNDAILPDSVYVQVKPTNQDQRTQISHNGAHAETHPNG